MNFISMPGAGMPHEPGFTGPVRGVNVPDGEVSVMPQPSVRSAARERLKPLLDLNAAAARRPSRRP